MVPAGEAGAWPGAELPAGELVTMKYGGGSGSALKILLITCFIITVVAGY